MALLSLEQMLWTLRAQGSELQQFEAKAARTALPKHLGRTFSAFANQTDGGTLLLGVADAPDFNVVGVEHVDKLQSRLASMVRDELSPSPRIHMRALSERGKQVLVVHVDEIEDAQKPCFIKKDGMHGGAYKRIGDQDQKFTPYEIFVLLSNQKKLAYDIAPVEMFPIKERPHGTEERMSRYAEKALEKRSAAFLHAQKRDELLRTLHLLSEEHVTLLGTLLCDDYPQRFFPKLRIVFVHTASENIEPTARYLDNKVFEGPLQEILESALRYVMQKLPQKVEVRGIESVPSSEIPQVALREALLNAVAHRDYSPMALGRDIQVRLSPHVLTIQNPGGLYGGLRIDAFEGTQSASRNRFLTRSLEDLGLMDNRGHGIEAMRNACHDAGLEPPQFKDAIDHFKVTFFRNHSQEKVAMVPGAPRGVLMPTSLSYSAARDRIVSSDHSHQPRSFLSPEQFLEHNLRFKRHDLVAQTGLTVGQAKYQLLQWLKTRMIRKYGRGKGTHYKVIRS